MFRQLAEFSLIVSFPILISRVASSKDGCNGVSLVTQVLHFVVFAMRYVDIFLEPSRSWGWYLPSVKAYLIAISAWVVVVMAYRFLMDWSTKPTNVNILKFFRTVALFLVPSILLGFGVNFLDNFYGRLDLSIGLWSSLMMIQKREWMEIFWASSQYLSGVCDIPQYLAYHSYLNGRQGHDFWLLASLFSLTNFRHFYIAKWIVWYADYGIFDLISLLGASIQIITFWIFMVMCRSRLKSNRITSDEEQGAIDGKVPVDAKA
ncbi:hypothetical protein C8J56DRAFT_1061665 [Mycena floridula]|nr:hypothetical protein C8J56DRAFT_1061665 [Mycena floridula]